jgi:hypothetical protein
MGKGRSFADSDGALLFRPGGHGSLIENLNRLDADLLLIKNIDNIVPDHLRAICVHWKRVSPASWWRPRRRFSQRSMTWTGTGSAARRAHSSSSRRSCSRRSRPGGERIGRGTRALRRERPRRPVRICGMVPASGETGGGPFWVSGRDGRTSLQIVETAQIDANAPGQRAAHAAATHFKPGRSRLRAPRSPRPSLRSRPHVDPAAAFITEKSSGGRTLRALEHPGLWNGAMADWTTVFVQVPLATFNPVKTVNDLLRPEHQ